MTTVKNQSPPASHTGTLKRGLKIGETKHKDYQFRRDINAGDYFAAEDEAGGKGTLRFDAALVARQLERIGEYTGPFSAGMLGTLHPNDLAELIRAREALERDDGDVTGAE